MKLGRFLEYKDIFPIGLALLLQSFTDISIVMINVLLKKKKSLNFFSKKEDGLSIVEVMMAFVVIAIVLIATAGAMTASFRSASYTENKSRAAAYAAEVIAVAKQADFKQLYLETQPTDPALFGQGKCLNNQTTIPAGSATDDMTIVKTGTGEPYQGLVYCQAKQAGNEKGSIGSTFYIQTKIVYLLRNQGSTSTNFYPKRVYVEVKWQDVYSGEGKYNTYTTSYTRSPSPKDCVPDRISALGATPAGCRP